jgi:hypothetical protein
MHEQRIPWQEAEPHTLERERAAMAGAAPDLTWSDAPPAGGWDGVCPLWPFDRPAPGKLREFVGERAFTIAVRYEQAHPMVPPRIMPIDPEPAIAVRAMHRWHLNGDGSLCLFQTATDWDGTGTAADLLLKAAAWYLEYLLMLEGRIEEMTECGIVHDDSLDALMVP